MLLTDADLTYIWLGPLGYLRQLPLLPVGDRSKADEDLIGGVHTSLAGTTTLDVVGHKRQWTLDWVCLTLAETTTVHAMYQHLTRSAIRIIDPRAGNRLTRDGASGGTYSRDTRAYATANGTVSWLPITDYPAAFAGLLDGGVQWMVPASTAGTLLIDDTTRIPLIPGEQVSLAVWVKGTLGVQVGAQTYDASGADAGMVLASSVTLGSWAGYTHTFTPGGTQVAASLAVTVASGAARPVIIGGALWHPRNTDWCPGAGCPRVLPISATTSNLGLANQDYGVVLREV